MGYPVIHALCLTLAHSLWQGALLAAVAGLIVLCTKRLSPALRYNLLVTALFLFAGGVFVTFAIVLEKGPVQAVSNVPVTTFSMVAWSPAPEIPTLWGMVNQYAGTIVAVWFIIICARSIQWSIGLYGTYRLRRVQVYPVSPEWKERVQGIAATMGIKKSIEMLESGVARVPMVIGHLKPIILIPLGLCTALPCESLEAILAHELAHIRRRDYLVNLLQSLLEILFFFNPALLWVSRLIKNERENCCDDLALEGDHDRAGYIRALLSCAEFQSALPAHAMGLAGNRHGLLRRVRRLAGDLNHSLSILEKTLLAICLVLCGICVSAFNRNPHKNPPAVKTAPIKSTMVAPKPDLRKPDIRMASANAEHRVLPPLPDTFPRATPLVVAPATEPVRPMSPYNSPYNSSHYNDKDPRQDEMLSDLVKDGYIGSVTDHIHFLFSNKSLIVNGEKVPDNVFAKYLAKFGPKIDTTGDWSWGHGQ
jgi:bla regulator protein BlaR1